MNDLIAQARRKYLAANPLRTSNFATVNVTGQPDVDEDVEEWVHTAMGIVKDPEMAAILFANVLRGMNFVIGSMTDRTGLREHLQRQAVDAWGRDFGDAA